MHIFKRPESLQREKSMKQRRRGKKKKRTTNKHERENVKTKNMFRINLTQRHRQEQNTVRLIPRSYPDKHTYTYTHTYTLRYTKGREDVYYITCTNSGPVTWGMWMSVSRTSISSRFFMVERWVKQCRESEKTRTTLWPSFFKNCRSNLLYSIIHTCEK